MERICEHCGEPFTSKRADASYCGHSCRQMAYLARRESSSAISEDHADLTIESPEPKIEDSQTTAKPIGEISGENDFLFLDIDEKADSLARHASQYLDYIQELIAYRQREVFLAALEIQFPEVSRWINTRCLCLIESLLAVSEKRFVELDDLKDISDALYLFLDSAPLSSLPVNYPYTVEMEKYYHIVRQFCLGAAEERVRIKLTRTTKAQLIASRFELAKMVPRIGFDQLNFSQ